jgi:RNA polymerase sigma-70 factor (ECF subfamily)
VHTDDLASIIERCRAGDPPAWEAFVRAYQGRLFALAYSYAGNREDARDLAQDMFIRLYEARGDWPTGDEFYPWLYRVARNRSVDFLRRRKVRTPAHPAGEDALENLADPAPDAEAAAVTSSHRRLLHLALQGLSAINREIVVLRDVHGLPVEQVSRMLRVPIGTVKSRASRARVELAARVLALSRGRSDA